MSLDRIIKFYRKTLSALLLPVADGKPRTRPWGFMMYEDRKFIYNQ